MISTMLPPDRISLQCERIGRYCFADAEVGRIRRRAVLRTDAAGAADAERLATIIVLGRILAAVDERGAKVLPAPVEASVKLIRLLVNLKYKAMTGDKDAAKGAERALDLAKKSPIRSVRAVAAGIAEFIK